MEGPVKQKLPLKKSKIGFPNLKNMKQHPPHIEMIKKVARRLGALRPKVVFLGGSSTGFHITDRKKVGSAFRTIKEPTCVFDKYLK